MQKIYLINLIVSDTKRSRANPFFRVLSLSYRVFTSTEYLGNKLYLRLQVLNNKRLLVTVYLISVMNQPSPDDPTQFGPARPCPGPFQPGGS